MLICKGEQAYKCSQIKTRSVGEIHCIDFSIIEPLSPVDVAKLFDDDTFYFYDDDFNSRMVETNDKTVVGLSIKYNADSTCDIKIRLAKGDVYDEG